MVLPREADVRPRGVASAVRRAGSACEPDARALAAAVLEPAGGIAGRVIDAATGRPVAGAALAPSSSSIAPASSAAGARRRADDQGRFLLGGLEPGVYNLLLMKVPGRPDATARAVEGVRVRAGDDTTADLAVIEGRPMRGVVVDRDDRPARARRHGRLLRPGPAPIRRGRPEPQEPTTRAASRSTSRPASSTSTSWTCGQQNSRLTRRSWSSPSGARSSPSGSCSGARGPRSPRRATRCRSPRRPSPRSPGPPGEPIKWKYRGGQGRRPEPAMPSQ